MNLFHKLTVKPWLTEPGAPPATGPSLNLPSTRVGLRILLTVITVLFCLFIVTYFSRSQYPDWQPLTGEPWLPLTNPWQLWINTGLLFLSSICMHFAMYAARNDSRASTQLGMLLGGLFAAAFIGGQLWIWQQFSSWGYGISDNPATSFFYLLTGIHGLHLLGGLVAWCIPELRLLRDLPLTDLRLNVELCTTYWHYLLIVWLLLFGLMASPPETYEAIAALCGFR